METSSLWMFLLLFTAVTGQTSITARLGQDVSLPCGYVIQHQQDCNRTSWLYSPKDGVPAEELITNGNISKSEAARAVRGRLHVPADCFLLIKNVRLNDVGRFTCRQFTSEGGHLDSMVFLSVINIVLDESFRFNCRVFSHGECEYTVQWDYKGDNGDIKTYRDPPCTATLTFNILPNFMDFKQQLFCNVTDKKSGQTLLCDTMDDDSPCERAGKGESSEGGRGGTSMIPEREPPPYPAPLRFILVSAGLAVLIIIVVSVHIWAEMTGKKTETDQHAVQEEEEEEEEEEEGEAQVIYENSADHAASVRLQTPSTSASH